MIMDVCIITGIVERYQLLLAGWRLGQLSDSLFNACLDCFECFDDFTIGVVLVINTFACNGSPETITNGFQFLPQILDSVKSLCDV